MNGRVECGSEAVLLVFPIRTVVELANWAVSISHRCLLEATLREMRSTTTHDLRLPSLSWKMD
jgi:hypothetical protein